MKKVAMKVKNMVKCNLHTHSLYCDGRGRLSDYVDTAIAQGVNVLGFSSHAPVKFSNQFSIDENRIEDYMDEIASLNQINGAKISLYTGLECDYIPSFSMPFQNFREKYNLDYVIGGVHLVENTENKQLWFIDGPHSEEYERGLKEVFGGDVKNGVTRYFHQMMEMIETQNFEILAHLDKIKMHNAERFFSEEDDWYRNLCMDVVGLLKHRNIIVEINTRGIYKKRCPDFYPSRFILEQLLKNKVRITLSSDAHQPEELVLLLDDAAKFAKEIGYGEIWSIGSDKKWIEIAI